MRENLRNQRLVALRRRQKEQITQIESMTSAGTSTPSFRPGPGRGPGLGWEQQVDAWVGTAPVGEAYLMLSRAYERHGFRALARISERLVLRSSFLARACKSGEHEGAPINPGAGMFLAKAFDHLLGDAQGEQAHPLSTTGDVRIDLILGAYARAILRIPQDSKLGAQPLLTFQPGPNGVKNADAILAATSMPEEVLQELPSLLFPKNKPGFEAHRIMDIIDQECPTKMLDLLAKHRIAALYTDLRAIRTIPLAERRAPSPFLLPPTSTGTLDGAPRRRENVNNMGGIRHDWGDVAKLQAGQYISKKRLSGRPQGADRQWRPSPAGPTPTQEQRALGTARTIRDETNALRFSYETDISKQINAPLMVDPTHPLVIAYITAAGILDHTIDQAQNDPTPEHASAALAAAYTYKAQVEAAEKMALSAKWDAYPADAQQRLIAARTHLDLILTGDLEPRVAAAQIRQITKKLAGLIPVTERSFQALTDRGALPAGALVQAITA